MWLPAGHAARALGLASGTCTVRHRCAAMTEVKRALSQTHAWLSMGIGTVALGTEGPHHDRGCHVPLRSPELMCTEKFHHGALQSCRGGTHLTDPEPQSQKKLEHDE